MKVAARLMDGNKSACAFIDPDVVTFIMITLFLLGLRTINTTQVTKWGSRG
jgi:hypothetical protein